MPKPITLEYAGRSQSVSAWARETGIRADVILSRLRNGWSIETTLTTAVGEHRIHKPRAYRGGRLIEYNGKIQTLSEWAAETGLPRSTINGRLETGWSPAEALTKPIHPHNSRGAGYKRKNMQNYMPPHRRPGYYPKPMNKRCESCHRECLGAGAQGLHGDHDPETEYFRGWLCFHCNTGIGKLGDSVQGLQEALNYLMRKARAT